MKKYGRTWVPLWEVGETELRTNRADWWKVLDIDGNEIWMDNAMGYIFLFLNEDGETEIWYDNI